MILAEARNYLSKYVDNGVCSSDARVISRINEAQRRLYAVKPWLGVMAKAICAVDYTATENSGGALVPVFALPQGGGDIGTDTVIGFGLQSASRVVEYVRSESEAQAANNGLILYPYIKTNSVDAFVDDPSGVLQVSPRASNFVMGAFQYVITPPKLAPAYAVNKTINYVEVTGQLKFKPVAKETDLLLIDDVDGLKLMLLALWREENNQMDLAKTLEAKAIDHMTAKTNSAIEVARKVSYQGSITNYPYGSMGFTRSKLALDLKGGLHLDSGELTDLINKSLDILVDEYNFLIRNGRYGVKENLPLLTHTFNSNDEQMLPIQDYSSIKLGVLAVQASNLNQPEAYSAYLKQAIDHIQQNLALKIEQDRHSVYQNMLDSSTFGTLGYFKAKLALDIEGGLSFSNRELTEMINRAQEKLIRDYNSLLKVGRYGVKDEMPLLAYTKQVNDTALLAIKNYEAIRYEVLADLALVSKDPAAADREKSLSLLAKQKLEEDFMTELEKKRHDEYRTGLANANQNTFLQIKSRLALELPDGLKISGFEIEQGIKKALEKLSMRYNSLLKTGRFGVKSMLPTLPNSFEVYDEALPPEPLRDFEVIKLAYLSIGALNGGSAELSVAFENQAFAKMEERVALELETKRHSEYQDLLDNSTRGTYGWAKARLALELQNGLRLSEKEITELVLKAQEKLAAHYNYLIKAGRLGVKKPIATINITSTPSDSALLPIQDYEAVKTAVMSLSALGAGQTEVSLALEKEAQGYLERNLITGLESERHTLYQNTLESSSPDSFGYFKARIALDLPDGLRLSEKEIGRLVNRAQETLILKGKWPGTIEEIKLTMPENGNVYLPFNIETVLSASLPGGRAIPIFGRSYDYHENGPGYSTSSGNNQDPALIDRGETIAEGRRVRVYFIRGNTGEEKCIRLLYKRKAIPLTADSDKMYLLNYPAILEMVMAFQVQATNPDVAKYHEENAIRLLRSELEENKGPNRYNLKVQAKAFSLSEIENLV